MKMEGLAVLHACEEKRRKERGRGEGGRGNEGQRGGAKEGTAMMTTYIKIFMLF